MFNDKPSVKNNAMLMNTPYIERLVDLNKLLRVLAEEQKLKRYICVSLEPVRRRSGGIDILPYREFLDLLWRQALV